MVIDVEMDIRSSDGKISSWYPGQDDFEKASSLTITGKTRPGLAGRGGARSQAPLHKSRVLCCATGLEIPGRISVAGPEWRIVLVGKDGAGKSSTGNTILGSEFFRFGMLPRSLTQVCQKEEAQLKGRKVVVVDTPGFFHTRHSQEAIAAEVSRSVTFCYPGPHVILRVMRPWCFSQEEEEVGRLIKEIFGPKAKDYMIVLFTHRDDLGGESLENWISSFDEKLKEYVAECGNRMLAFNNKAGGAERDAQVAKLMAMIDDLVERNRNAPCYTEDMMNVKHRRKFF